ncbi:MAG: hypothetical protein IPK08_18255 [Bacteroidetes bacterium]|nr:hypothetical protein [Bacteroidota bacterium]
MPVATDKVTQRPNLMKRDDEGGESKSYSSRDENSITSLYENVPVLTVTSKDKGRNRNWRS